MTETRTSAMDACFCQQEECVLCEARLYSELSSEQVCQVRGMLHKHQYGSHEILFREGDPSTHLYVLRDGQLKLTIPSASGREQIIGLGVQGHLLGFDTMDDPIYTYTAETLTPVLVCTIRLKDMLKVLQQNPKISMRVVEILNEELAQAQALIRVLGQKTSMEKVATFILSLIPATKNGRIPEQLSLPLSRQEIAELLGLTVETVSRLMSDLKREGVIEAPRGLVRILDINRLQSLAGGRIIKSLSNGRPGITVKN
jgi:CRP/FNR family transcriptional regulator, anaerobic regulatory protein